MAVLDSNTDQAVPPASAFDGSRLRSVFQPIYSVSHRQSVGFEALVRADDERSRTIAPRELFDRQESVDQLLLLDALSQSLHISRFAAGAHAQRWLFLNIDPATIDHRRYRDGALADTLTRVGLSADRLVIEILESHTCEPASLREAVDYFRSRGALVAIDDFGAGHSNFDRIWRLAPEIVKLDSSLIWEAAQHRSGRLGRMLPNLVALLQEAECLVLAEGIESETHALTALDAGVDLVQGFYFARPASTIEPDRDDTARALQSLATRFDDAAWQQDRRAHRRLTPYIEAFRAVSQALGDGAPIADTCRTLLDLPDTARCYLLDDHGTEIEHYCGHASTARSSDRADPMNDSSGGAWSHRQYFREAIVDPGHLKISRPRMPSARGQMRFTLAIASDSPAPRVFCCDVYC